MKQLFLAASILLSLQSSLQTTALLTDQKDAWGVSYTYTGEVKGGKPHGMGVARYSGGNALRYVGGFADGMFSGKGALLFADGSFQTGNWSNGKLNGGGSTLNRNGDFYIGDFKDGQKNGRGVYYYPDNSFYVGGFMNDKFQRRGIYINAKGDIISDNLYADGKMHGTGYQYEVSSKKLFEGEWKEGTWVQSVTASYNSFLKHPDLIGEKTEKHILIGPVDNKRLLKDTSYYYDLAKRKRFFGWYEFGYMKNGITIKDDSTRFKGTMGNNGASGYCYLLKPKNYYTEGEYHDDFITGSVLEIDLKKRTVYIGVANDGYFTGKAYFFNDKDDMYSGDYVKGNFTGQGYRLQRSGRAIAGTWKDGSVVQATSIHTPGGEVIATLPKSFGEGLNTIIKSFPSLFDEITGPEMIDFPEVDADLKGTNDYESYVRFPGAAGKDFISLDFKKNDVYVVKFIETSELPRATAKYKEIGGLIAATTISNKLVQPATKLKGTLAVIDPDKQRNLSKFKLSNPPDAFKDFQLWLIMSKNNQGTYSVLIVMGRLED